MELTAIVTVLAVLQYSFFGIQVGSMRPRLNIKAPATTGTPEFERMFRVHYNTMEQMVAFLPAYSPDFNPIEKMWSKVKAHLRRAKARTEDTLNRAVARALKRVTHNDAAGWFKHCGYQRTQS